MTIPAVFYLGRTYTNVVITVGVQFQLAVSMEQISITARSWCSCCSGTGQISITTNNVIAPSGGILVSFGGKMPTNLQDVASPAIKTFDHCRDTVWQQRYNAVITIGRCQRLADAAQRLDSLFTFTGGNAEFKAAMMAGNRKQA